MAVHRDRRVVVVVNEQGLHARPADLLARAANRFEADVVLIKDGERFDAKSILSVLSMGAAQGTRIEIEAEGPDAVEAVQVVATLIDSGFAESTGTGCAPADTEPCDHAHDAAPGDPPEPNGS